MRLGNITRRGKASWRIKLELPRDLATGKRRMHLETVTGTRDQAKARLVEISESMRKGFHVEPSALTIAEYLRVWLASPAGITPKTAERYLQLAEQQIIPHLGALTLQKLAKSHIQDWHATLLKSGGKGGRPLNARTVGHAHRVLHRALTRAVEGERVFRNVASAVKPPKVEEQEIEILGAGQMAELLAALADHPLYPLVTLALGTGMRRGELIALQWTNLDLEGASVFVVRSAEETKQGIRIKTTKTRYGRRRISLPPMAVDALRVYRTKQLEQRVALGLGKLPEDALVFGGINGEIMSPDNLSRDWRRLVIARRLPDVSFHALRHSHASALIDAGIDVIQVSRRLGHSSPAFTVRVYGHIYSAKDTAAAGAAEAAMQASRDH